MRSKQDIREAMWAAMVGAGASRSRNVHDRIPDFHGSREAAEQICDLAVWQAAHVVKSNPDQPQRALAPAGVAGRKNRVHGGAPAEKRAVFR